MKTVPEIARNTMAVDSVLSNYRGKAVYFHPLWGNNGDKLIEIGSRSVLSRLQMPLVDDPSHADILVINGGFAMSDIWSIGLEVLRDLNSNYPTIPLVVLPSSFLFSETDIASLFLTRKSEAFVFAREEQSRNVLLKSSLPNTAVVSIDHDMAFRIRGTTYFNSLGESISNSHILIVERDDLEGRYNVLSPQDNLARSALPSPRTILRTVSPKWLHSYGKRIKQRMGRHIWHKKSLSVRYTPFVTEGLHRAHADFPHLSNLPIVAADISRQDRFSFSRFGELIAGAAVIITDRLHVGILGSMMGKPTFIKEGSTHKLRGIVEYSMRDMSHVRLF